MSFTRRLPLSILRDAFVQPSIFRLQIPYIQTTRVSIPLYVILVSVGQRTAILVPSDIWCWYADDSCGEFCVESWKLEEGVYCHELSRCSVTVGFSLVTIHLIYFRFATH